MGKNNAVSERERIGRGKDSDNEERTAKFHYALLKTVREGKKVLSRRRVCGAACN